MGFREGGEIREKLLKLTMTATPLFGQRTNWNERSRALLLLLLLLPLLLRHSYIE